MKIVSQGGCVASIVQHYKDKPPTELLTKWKTITFLKEQTRAISSSKTAHLAGGLQSMTIIEKSGIKLKTIKERRKNFVKR